MNVLTRLDPAAYGVDPIRRVVLGASGVPQAALDRSALTLFDRPLPIPAEAGILIAFGLVMTGIAVLSFRRQD